MTLVLDACAIMAYLRDEEGADVVEAAFMADKGVHLAGHRVLRRRR